MSDTDYDEFAEVYSAENDEGFFNEHYARPAIVGLAGDLTGRRVLDAGCGSGQLMATMRQAGAEVVGFDRSGAMLDLARRRLGDGVDLRVHDLAAPLPYGDAAFDVAVASLVLHYLEDWSVPLAELRRVLRPGGRLLVAVNHPSGYAIVYPDADYFATTRYTEDYEMQGRTVPLTFWHRPLHAMADAVAAAGFRIAGIGEPPSSVDTPAAVLPPGLSAGQRFIGFLFLDLEAPV